MTAFEKKQYYLFNIRFFAWLETLVIEVKNQIPNS